ncbi:MAG: hypothetical protein Ct9H300mP3_11710 [Gammaproteobacteria bacterium]|nr:MAG: hypothetical protein Ct9H300mP3_11710 [Gammaproteobacteria bacterium]
MGLKIEKPEDFESAMKQCFELKDKLVFLDIVIDKMNMFIPCRGWHGYGFDVVR